MIAWNLVRFYGTKHATDALRLFEQQRKIVRYGLKSVLVYFTVKSIKWGDLINVIDRQLRPLCRYEMVNYFAICNLRFLDFSIVFRA